MTDTANGSKIIENRI